MRHRRDRSVERDRDMASNEIGHARCAALVRHVHQLCLRHLLEHFSGEVGGTTNAEGRVRQLAGARLGQFHQINDVLRRQRRVHRQHQRRVTDDADRRKVLFAVRQPGVNQRIGHEGAAGTEQQGVTVDRRLGNDFGRDDVGRAGPAAPGRLSLTKFWPRFFVSCCAMRRPMMSPPPPGEDGLTSRTGRFGYPAAGSTPCACAATQIENTPASTADASRHDRNFIAVTPRNGHAHDSTAAAASHRTLRERA